MVLLLAIYYAPAREKMQYQNAYILYIFSKKSVENFLYSMTHSVSVF